MRTQCIIAKCGECGLLVRGLEVLCLEAVQVSGICETRYNFKHIAIK